MSSCFACGNAPALRASAKKENPGLEQGETAPPFLRTPVAHQLSELKGLAHVVDEPLILRLPELKQAGKPRLSRNARSAFEKRKLGQHARRRHLHEARDQVAGKLGPEQLGKPGPLRRGRHRRCAL